MGCCQYKKEINEIELDRDSKGYFDDLGKLNTDEDFGEMSLDSDSDICKVETANYPKELKNLTPRSSSYSIHKQSFEHAFLIASDCCHLKVNLYKNFNFSSKYQTQNIKEEEILDLE